MAKYNLNEVLKKKYATEKSATTGEVKLDDVSRVKVLSPGRQVAKRFARNSLAVFGTVTLTILFIFCFLGPVVYPYGQKQIFYKYDGVNSKLGVATKNTSFTGYVVDPSVTVNTNANSYMTTYIKEMQASGAETYFKMGEDGMYYQVDKLGDNIYTMSQRTADKVASFGVSEVYVCSYDSVSRAFKYNGEAQNDAFEAKAKTVKGNKGSFIIDGKEYSYSRGTGKSYLFYTKVEGFVYEDKPLSAAFEKAAEASAAGELFSADGNEYLIESSNDTNVVYQVSEAKLAKVFTTFVIDLYDSSFSVTPEFRNEALLAAYSASSFTADGKTYHLQEDESVILIFDAEGKEVGEFSTFIIRRVNGDDSIDFDAKVIIREAIEDMAKDYKPSVTVKAMLPQQTEDGQFYYNAEGKLEYTESEITINATDRNYELWCNQIKYVIDRFASPSSAHLLGTDGDGFDVFARVMYGGRVSLMVGFVVVFIETFLGVIMGGLAGYYGGWVDNLIMRMVDIFYCLPSMPIMIILGSMMDAMRLDVYTRLFIMMAALGVMGWAGIARLVRGQILSFREQEFMVAAEATGIKVKDRIFKHLIPNVMPQLIVSATMGMGGTILTESTLSFLGLGVKHPLATWGTMINSVSTASAMAHYAYIWIPVGLLICFTVIAFNFVGDGLRDAYDPKSRR